MAKQKPRGRPFPKGGPGGPGRKPGVPNKATQDIKEFSRAMLEDADYRERLKDRLAAGEAQPIEIMLHHYAYGKPKETIAVEQAPPILVIDQLTDGSDS